MFKDWYLPSLIEVDLIYQYDKTFKPELYWVSDEHKNNSYAYARKMDTGFVGVVNKDAELNIRGIRNSIRKFEPELGSIGDAGGIVFKTEYLKQGFYKYWEVNPVDLKGKWYELVS